MEKIDERIYIFKKSGKEFRFNTFAEFTLLSISFIKKRSLIIIIFNYFIEIKIGKNK